MHNMMPYGQSLLLALLVFFTVFSVPTLISRLGKRRQCRLDWPHNSTYVLPDNHMTPGSPINSHIHQRLCVLLVNSQSYQWTGTDFQFSVSHLFLHSLFWKFLHYCEGSFEWHILTLMFLNWKAILGQWECCVSDRLWNWCWCFDKCSA